jgi:hypothetical protein
MMVCRRAREKSCAATVNKPSAAREKNYYGRERAAVFSPALSWHAILLLPKLRAQTTPVKKEKS